MAKRNHGPPKRLEAYRRETRPLEDFYRKKGLLREVNGNAPVDEVQARIIEALKSSLVARKAV